MPTTSAKLPINVASHADVLKGSSRVSRAGTRDEPLTTSAWEATINTALE